VRAVTGLKRLILGCGILAAMGISSPAVATTLYRVRLNTAEFTGTARWLALDWISGGSSINSARIASLVADGRRGRSRFQGGPVFGGLADGVGPPVATLQDSSFYNQLVLPVDSMGTFAGFDIGTSENVTAGEMVRDELSFYFLNPDDLFPFGTADPLGANALFAIDVTGQSGGDLSVFAPMRFVPPDTLLLNNSTDDVALGYRITGRLQFRSIVPNPSSGGVRLDYAIPEPGGELRVKIFDVAGRLVAQPFTGRREARTWTTQWDARDVKGRSVPAGVYLVQLQMGGQSFVRRFVLAR